MPHKHRGCTITAIEPLTLAEQYIVGREDGRLFEVSGRYSKRANLRPFLLSYDAARSWIDGKSQRRGGGESDGDDGERDVSGVGE